MKRLILICLMVFVTFCACDQLNQPIDKPAENVESTKIILLEEISTETPAEDICDENNVSDECLYGVP